MKKILFVCNQNKNRSPTAASIFSGRYETKSAGLYCEGNKQLTKELLEWADIVFVMEQTHRNKVSNKYKELLKGKRLIVLGIPDNYQCMQPELIRLLKAKVLRLVS